MGKTQIEVLQPNSNEADCKLISILSKVGDSIRSNYRPFPVEAFTIPEISQAIVAWERSQNYSRDYFGAAMLFALSAAIGNVYKIEVKPGFIQPAMIYMVLVGNPGANKSAPLGEAVKPIIKKDELLYQSYKESLKTWAHRMSEIKQSKETGVEEPEKPVRQKTFISDSTQEAVAYIHKNNPRGIAVYADEFAGWFKNFSRYSKGSDQENWLQTWSGVMFNIDRKNTESISIYSPFISVGGTMQPGVLHQLLKDDRGDNGFIDRLLFAYPDKEPSTLWNDEELPEHARTVWTNLLNRVLELEQGYDDHGHVVSRIIKLSSEAKATLFDWQHRNAAEALAVEPKLAGIYRKMDTYLVRFALIIQVLRYVSNVSTDILIDNEAAKGAVMLAEYFKHNANKVYEMATGTDPLAGLSPLQKSLFLQLPKTFHRSDVIELVDEMGMSHRTFDRWLKDAKLFTKIKQGYYEKAF